MRDPRLSHPHDYPVASSSRRPVHRDVLEPDEAVPRGASFDSRTASAPGAPIPTLDAPRQQQPSSLQWAQRQHEYFHRRQVQQSYLAPPPASSFAPPQRRAQPPPQHQAPPPSIHRVYNVRCATCDTFLSDRGMRAVLLLKPHIVLFSTDAAPSNSETFYPRDEGCTEEEHIERTCECLTSSINCHGCGRTVGYHIVAPCAKCNSHQRSANHHRFVFHAGEVTARERSYYPGERGVLNPIVARSTSPSSTSRGASPAGRPTDKDPRTLRAPTPPRGACEPPRLLQRGDTLYWHHLQPGGERSKSVDPRTRAPFYVERDGR
ncbi:hypothetical protein JCM9279_007362 [Rhodotorula babjevae]